MTLAADIQKCLDLVRSKGLNDDFSLWHIHCPPSGSYPGSPPWRAGIVNDSRYVQLGEAEPRYFGEGDSPEEAVTALLNNLLTMIGE